jgi:2,3-bisphosphoglycerate-dependent phosphoglycerate mutase
MPYLILLRHGESQFNQESRFCGWINAPLTDKGREQAVNTAQLLQNDELTSHIPIHLLVTSRLKRAVLTAEIILEQIDRLDVDVVKTWRLNERHYGSLQGLKKK